MAKKNSSSKAKKQSVSSNVVIGVSSKGKKAPTPTPPKEKEKLTKKQIIILVSVVLIAVMIGGAIIGIVAAVKRINNPDFLKSNLSRYIYISEDDYSGYEINIPLEEFSEEDVLRKINSLLTEHKTSAEERYNPNTMLSLGDTVKIYYRGYTVGEDGRETDFSGSSNFSEKSPTILEVGTGKVINASNEVSGSFIPGFAEGLEGIIPKDYLDLEKITEEERVMAGDVIYLSYTVIGGKDGVNKTVTAERIDLALPYIDELYGKGFTEFFVGKLQDGEQKDFKLVGEEIEKLICRIGDSETDTVYTDMKVEFLTRGCEDNPINLKVKFPASYAEESLRDKDAYFDVYIVSASTYDTPVFDEKFITEKLKVTAADLSSYKGETLVEKYKDKLTEECKAEIEEANQDILLEEVWKQLLSKVEVKKLPKGTVEGYYNYYYSTIGKYYYNVYSQSYSSIDAFAIDYLNAYYGAGLDAGADWNAHIRKLAEEDTVKNLLVKTGAMEKSAKLSPSKTKGKKSDK